MKRKYDLAISFGGSCSTTEAMRAAGLQWTTLPLDWTGGTGLIARAKLMADDFAGFLEKSSLRQQPAVKFSREVYMKDVVLGYNFNHDFSYGVPFDEDYLRVKAKFDRRISRLYDLIGKSRRILVLWLGVPVSDTFTEQGLVKCQQILSERWPDKQFDVLYSEHVDGVAFADRNDYESDGIRIVKFDYRKREEGNGEWLADVELLTRWLASEYEVPDYRTVEEKRAWKQRQRKTRYGRYHADGLFDYLRTKMEYKLFRHLGKLLSERGIV